MQPNENQWQRALYLLQKASTNLMLSQYGSDIDLSIEIDEFLQSIHAETPSGSQPD